MGFKQTLGSLGDLFFCTNYIMDLKGPILRIISLCVLEAET